MTSSALHTGMNLARSLVCQDCSVDSRFKIFSESLTNLTTVVL